MATALKDLIKDINERAKKVNDIFDLADKEQDGVCTDEQIAEVKRLNQEKEDMEKSAKSLEEQDALRKANRQFMEESTRIFRPEFSDGREGPKPGEYLKGNIPPHLMPEQMAKHFINDPTFKNWLNNIAPNGQIPEKMRINNSPAVNFDFGLKTLLTGASDTSAGAAVFSERFGILEPGTFMRPLKIRDLISIGTTTSDTVEYVRIGTPTNNAAPVAEATATSGSTGTKPESALPMSVVTERVRTIATWIPATRRALMDFGQLQTLVEDVLRYMLDEEFEDQIIAGDGSGENFTGILNTPNTLSQAFTTDLLTTARKARTKVVLAHSMPTAWVIHPNDWETFDLEQDAEERYYFGGPIGIGTPRLWGVPVIESEAMTQGTAVLGEWRWIRVWDRMRSAIYVSDSHSDFFIRNLIAILAEAMAAMGVIRPSAFCEVAWS